MPLRSSLADYWTLDESSGNNRADSVGDVALAENGGSAGSSTGLIGNAADFDGGAHTLQGIHDVSAPGWDTPPFSLSVWFNPASLADSAIFAKGYVDSGGIGWALKLTSGGGLIVEEGGTDVITSGTTISASSWTHAVIVDDGSTVSLYINGSFESSASSAFASSARIVAFGGKSLAFGPPYAQDNFTGLIDEAAFWSKALTSGEVASLYNGGSGIAGPGFGYALGFATQPSNVGHGVAISPSPAVEILDESGTRDTAATDSITLAIGTNPSGGTLSTTTNPLAATAGLATFTSTSIDNAGTGYTLTAAATGLTGATSSSFDITGTGIAIDATSSSAEQTSSSLSWSHTTSGSDRYLLVEIAMESNGGGAGQVTALTYNGASLTRLARHVGASSGDLNHELWGLVSPDTGTHTISATLDQSVVNAGEAISLTGVSPARPVSYTRGSGVPSPWTITPDCGGCLIVGAGTFAAGTFTSDNDERITLTIGTHFSVGALDLMLATAGPITPAAATTLSWTATGPVVNGPYVAAVIRPSGVSDTISWDNLAASAGSQAVTGRAASFNVKMPGSAGSFSEAGQAATLHAARKLGASAGSETLSGQAAGLAVGHKLSAAAGADTFTGQAASLFKGFKIIAAAGSDAWTGGSAPLKASRKIAAGAGSLAETGQTAPLLVGRRIAAAAGSDTVASATNLFHGYPLTAMAGSFTEGGQNATLRHGFSIAAVAGVFVETGDAAGLAKGRILTGVPGVVQLLGPDAALRAAHRLVAAAGAETLTGQAATLHANYPFTAAHGQFAKTGQPARLFRGRKIVAAAGHDALTGKTAKLARHFLFTAVAHGTFLETGQPAVLHYGRTIHAAKGSVAESGQPATMKIARKIAAAAGSDVLSGGAASLIATRLLVCAAGVMTEAGQAAGLHATRNLSAVAGLIAETGSDAGLHATRKLAAAAGSDSITGKPANLSATRPLRAAAGSIVQTGQPATLRATRKLSAAPGPIAETGGAAALSVGRLLVGAHGSAALTGSAAGLKATRSILAAAGRFEWTGAFAFLVGPAGRFDPAWQWVEFVAGLPHAAFAAPADVAFGSLADPVQSNKGHVAFGGDDV
jgi:hypothetical protein